MGFKLGCLLALICSVSIVIAVLSATIISFFLFYETGNGLLSFVCLLFISYVVILGLRVDTQVFSLEITSVSTYVGRAFRMLRGLE